MIKVFLILASVVLLGSAVLGWMNRDEFVNVRLEKDQKNKDIAAKEDETEDGIDALKTQRGVLDGVHGQYDEAVISRNNTEGFIKGEQKLLDAEMDIRSGLMERKAEQDKILTDLEVAVGRPIDDLDELDVEIAKMTDDLANAEKEKEELEKNLMTMNNHVKRNEGTIGTLTEKQQVRSQGINLNGTEGTITAVNQDWGFVVINIGKNQGVDGNSELIVKRGTEVVGKLAMVSIEPRQTVADIRMDTLKKGARILPGDKVIFEKLQN